MYPLVMRLIAHLSSDHVTFDDLPITSLSYPTAAHVLKGSDLCKLTRSYMLVICITPTAEILGGTVEEKFIVDGP